MASTIITKYGSGAPLASDLVRGELAVDTENGRLYTEDSLGAVVEIGTNPTTLAVDTDTLVVDSANNRVGVGTASPSFALDVRGSDATIQARATNASGTATLNLYGIDSTGSNLAVTQIKGVAEGATPASALTFSTRDSVGTTSEAMRIDSSGHAIIPAGVTLGTAAGTYNAANTLDYYEEGTWTPAFSGATGGITYNSATGYYTIIGNIAIVQFHMDISVTTVTGSNLNIGFPAAVNPIGSTITKFHGGTLTQTTGLNLTEQQKSNLVLASYLAGTAFFFYDNGTASVYNGTTLPQTGEIAGTVIYTIA